MPISDDFRSDGGATWLNLLATRGQTFGPRPVERLPDPEAAHAWLDHAGFPARTPPGAAGLARILELREALRDLAMAAVEGRSPSAEATSIVHAVASSSGTAGFPEMLRDGDVSLDAALGATALQALVTLAGPDRRYLRECAETDCRWVFLDTSGRRHWCPAPACASRGRVRAHRARRIAAENAESAP